MFKPLVVRIKTIIAMILVIMVVMPFSTSTLAQTPDAETQPPVETATEVPTEAPPPVETQTEVPLPVETPTEVPPPVETATEVVPPTSEPVIPTATVAPTAEDAATPGNPATQEQEPTPTPTTEATGPDQLIVVGESVVAIGPGEVRDITVRYTLGSDRARTELAVDLAAPGGESLEGWTIAPLNRVDTLEDPNDPNRAYTARVDIADVTANGDVLDATWRVAAPAHIETPINMVLSFASTIHEPVGESTAVTAPDLVSVSAQASGHAPTLDCTPGAANTWSCAFNTAHPGSIAMEVSAVVPTGWELTISGLPLTTVPTALDPATVAAGSFGIVGTYPVGCPDSSVSANVELSIAFSYPSSDVVTLAYNLPVFFDRPLPTLSVQDFEFTEFDQLETLTTRGSLTLTYTDAPCAWQASLHITELHSDNFTIDDAVISVVGTDGLADATVTMTDGTITILAPERPSAESDGVITIHLQIVLPHQVPPGAYIIGVRTEIAMLDEM